MATRRRLPVIQSSAPAPSGGGKDKEESPSDDDAIEVRPPWHWVGFGTVAIFAGWLPLAYAAQAAITRVVAQRFGAAATAEEIRTSIGTMPAGERARLMALLALPNVLALALAAFGGGYVVGRFGTGTGPREAATAGAMTALVALVLSLGGGAAGGGVTAIATSLVTVVIAVGFAAWGGRVGTKKRRVPPP